jgi:hypothetical protein
MNCCSGLVAVHVRILTNMRTMTDPGMMEQLFGSEGEMVTVQDETQVPIQKGYGVCMNGCLEMGGCSSLNLGRRGGEAWSEDDGTAVHDGMVAVFCNIG